MSVTATYHAGMDEDIASRGIRVISPWAPLRWLRAGMHDFRRAPALGLMHGSVFAVGAVLIAWLGWGHWAMLCGAFSGFLLVAPLLAGGLYENSRRLERDERPTLRDVVTVWLGGAGSLVRLALMLGLLGSAWVGVSAAIGYVMVGPSGGGVREFLLRFLLAQHHAALLAWLMAGGMLAALVFTISVISVPMLVDREVPTHRAVLVSVAAVGLNPVAMLHWAVWVMGLAAVSVLTIVPLLVIVPVLGHASWHAWRETIDGARWAPRT